MKMESHGLHEGAPVGGVTISISPENSHDEDLIKSLLELGFAHKGKDIVIFLRLPTGAETLMRDASTIPGTTVIGDSGVPNTVVIGGG